MASAGQDYVPLIFISSTKKDLGPYRDAAREAVERADLRFRRMETFAPQSKHETYEGCMAEVAECDVVVVIVAHRYGWTPGGKDKSITWLECEAALNGERKKEVLAFVVDEAFAWPDNLREEYRPMEAFKRTGRFPPDLVAEVERNVSRLKDFKAWLGALGFFAHFTTPDNLQTVLLHALNKWKERNGYGIVPPAAKQDVSKYLAGLREHTGWIDIRGLQVGSGSANRVPINDLYIPLTSKGRDASERVPLEAALTNRRIVISGDPGSGKTTFLHRIAWERLQDHGMSGFPVFIRIGNLEDHLRKNAQSAGTPLKESAAWLPHYLTHLAREKHWDLDFAFFDSKLGEPGTIILLDGLDEAPDPLTRESMARLFEDATHVYREARFVVTTRPGAYQGGATLEGFYQVSIADLDVTDIKGFLDHWTRFLFPNDAERAARHNAELLEALQARIEIRRMASNPVMLTALAVVHWNERRLPEQRADLYESIVIWLARAREHEGRERYDRCLAILSALALGMQTELKGRATQISKGRAAELIAGQFRETEEDRRYARALEFIEREEVDSGIFSVHGSELRFRHLTFQEYLTARGCAGLMDATQKEVLFKEGRLYRPEWRETMRLLGGVLIRLGADRVDGLVSSILDNADGSQSGRVLCVGLLGAMLRDLRALQYEVGDSRYAVFLKEALAVFEPETGGIDLKMRVEAADALGQAGDPRLHVNNWIKIPACTLAIGEGKAAEEIDISAYQIGRYPVTVEEYAKFMDEEGYENQQWWAAGKPENEGAPHDWDQQLLHPNRPVVGVCWYEAAAYSAWKGCYLPTNVQWERAARGVEGRIYPWGDEEPDTTRANYRETGIGAPSPVGLFPRGRTKEGVDDLAGNVWEWVGDEYVEGEQDYRIARGGLWFGGAGFLRAAFRDWHRPGIRSERIGFRCARHLGDRR